MKKIKISNIQYLALSDDRYADNYALDNEMTDVEKQDWLNKLKQKTEITIEVDGDFEDDDELHEYLEQVELCEYIIDFDWEYIMKKIVLSYNFQSGQIGYNIISEDVYEFIKKTYPNYKDILMDSDTNPFGLTPKSISVDLYDNAELVQVIPECDTIEFLLGMDEWSVSGTLLKHVEVI